MPLTLVQLVVKSRVCVCSLGAPRRISCLPGRHDRTTQIPGSLLSNFPNNHIRNTDVSRPSPSPYLSLGSPPPLHPFPDNRKIPRLGNQVTNLKAKSSENLGDQKLYQLIGLPFLFCCGAFFPPKLKRHTRTSSLLIAKNHFQQARTKNTHKNINIAKALIV